MSILQNLIVCQKCSSHSIINGLKTTHYSIVNDFLSVAGKRTFRTSARHFRLPRKRMRNSPEFPSSYAENPQPLLIPGVGDSSRLWKPVLFTAAFGSASVSAAAIWQYENIRARHTAASPFQYFNNWNTYEKRIPFREDLNKIWKRLTEAEKIFAPICFANVLVYLAWKNPQWQPTMLKYFCTNAASNSAESIQWIRYFVLIMLCRIPPAYSTFWYNKGGQIFVVGAGLAFSVTAARWLEPVSVKALCWPMLLSTFSQYMFLHLAANMFVLHSFSHGVVASLGKEQFTAMYLTGGVVASLASIVTSVAMAAGRHSLGASGAVMAVIGYSCMAYPTSQVSVIFLPTYTVNAETALKVLMAIDLAGLIFKWRFFDHAAHLGGALFGVMWYFYGRKYVWGNREYVVKPWHEWRTSGKTF